MTRKLDVTARQVEAICRGAAKAQYIPTIKIGNAFIKLTPKDAINNNEILDDKGKGYL